MQLVARSFISIKQPQRTTTHPKGTGMSKPRILTGFTYSMDSLVATAMHSGVELVLPRTAAFLGKVYGLDVVDLPRFSNKLEATVEFAKLIEEYSIHAFWPLASSAYDITQQPDAHVHAVCRYKTFAMVNDKVTFASWLSGSQYRPEGVETVGAEKTMEEIRARLEAGQRVCIKPPRGVNGGGFWEITPKANLLADPNARQIRPEVFESELQKFELDEGMERFLVMEMLTGTELSIDALCFEGQLLKWLIREKVSPSKQVASSNHEIMGHVRHIIKALRLHGLVSVQYMYDKHGEIKILEINLRPSGGCLTYGGAIFGKVGTSDLLTDWLQLMGGLITPDDIQQWEGEYTFKTPTVAVME